MRKRILGLDLGTNSIGWALVLKDLENKFGEIIGAGSRIIPMSTDVVNNFEKGITKSQTADRTDFRGTRRLYERSNIRRERLHRVLNVLEYLPESYVLPKRRSKSSPELWSVYSTRMLIVHPFKLYNKDKTIWKDNKLMLQAYFQAANHRYTEC